MAGKDFSGNENKVQFRQESDSAQHDMKERQQIDILLQFFEASRNYCVCFVDMVDSTTVIRQINDQKVGRYFGFFLNKMANMAANFGAIVVKNMGDSILYYFPDTESESPASFRRVLECGMAMIEERDSLNRTMRKEGLPDLNYRISCEYGSVAVARVSTSSVNDIFGSTVNYCSKINPLAPSGGMVIGQALYEKVMRFDKFKFTESSSTFGEEKYRVYIVEPA
jgi:adenylate cyclase